jgi:hypothetical protein
MFLSIVTLAVLLVFIFANLVKGVFLLYYQLKEKYKR